MTDLNLPNSEQFKRTNTGNVINKYHLFRLQKKHYIGLQIEHTTKDKIFYSLTTFPSLKRHAIQWSFAGHDSFILCNHNFIMYTIDKFGKIELY